ncbi:hypothetical protein [Stenotrophomonas sp. S41]|uniref:hypothetical protein n=1 Tax=Stenotrophomonas sp. S41 TaxID=2767464 RepID=UPI00190B7453|nr:hypothetical protein [Stenotrophomonas sp. S41]MBK0010773.1 hypothetical protein [Stenotrophomonas sp. S41]
MNTFSESESPWGAVLRKVVLLFLLGVCMTLPILMLRLDVQIFANGVGEGGAVENAQLLLLGISIASLTVLAKVNQQDKKFALLAAAFFACMFVRECDFFLNELVPHLWQYIVAVLSISALAYAASDPRSTAFGGLRFLRTDGGALVLPGLAVLLIYSRLMGMQDIWIDLLQDGYVRSVKNAIEETTELLGYTVIAFSIASGVISRVTTTARDRKTRRTTDPGMPSVRKEAA